MTSQRPLPDSRESQERKDDQKLVRWVLLAIVTLLVLVALGLLLTGRTPATG